MEENDGFIQLTRNEQLKIKEMIEWAFGDTSVQTTNFKEYYTITDDGRCRSYKYFYYTEALLVHIPRALGIKVIFVDPLNQDSLLKQITEKYDIFNTRNEKVELKAQNEFLEEGCWDGI